MRIIDFNAKKRIEDLFNDDPRYTYMGCDCKKWILEVLPGYPYDPGFRRPKTSNNRGRL
jgi:hypothetical protein